jgi:hypothetical protein
MKRALITFCVCVILCMMLLYRYTKGVDAYFDPIPKTSLDDFIDNAQTGDLVFFWFNNAQNGLKQYCNYFTSSLQAKATDTPFTHVSLVHRTTGLPGSPDRVCFVTADRYPNHDLITDNEQKTGNQYVDAKAYLSGYNGRVCWYRLSEACSESLASSAFEEFKSRINHEYCFSILMFMNLGFQTWNNTNQPKKTICTTTVFDFLRTAGIITADNIYVQMNKMNIGLRELIDAVAHTQRYYEPREIAT